MISECRFRWNEIAYANSHLLVDWINQMLVPVLPPGPRLLVLHVAKFHSTQEVLSTLCSHDIVPSLIPPGCTGLVQPLDVSVNKPFKCLLPDILDELLDDFEPKNNLNLLEIPRANSPAIAERRILVTQAVGLAWDQSTRKYQELFVKTFRKSGLTLPIDGSCDDELSVKGIEPALLQIGDWTSIDSRLRNSPLAPSGDPLNTLHTSTLGVGQAGQDLGVEFIDRE